MTRPAGQQGLGFSWSKREIRFPEEDPGGVVSRMGPLTCGAGQNRPSRESRTAASAYQTVASTALAILNHDRASTA
jgi:hypothetical protein